MPGCAFDAIIVFFILVVFKFNRSSTLSSCGFYVRPSIAGWANGVVAMLDLWLCEGELDHKLADDFFLVKEIASYIDN